MCGTGGGGGEGMRDADEHFSLMNFPPIKKPDRRKADAVDIKVR